MPTFLVPDEILLAIRSDHSVSSQGAWRSLRASCVRWVGKFGQGLDASDIVDAAIVENIAEIMDPTISSSEVSTRLARSLNKLRASARRERLRRADEGIVEDMIVTLSPDLDAGWTLREIYGSLNSDQRRFLPLLLSGFTSSEIARKLSIDRRKVHRELGGIRSAIESLGTGEQIQQPSVRGPRNQSSAGEADDVIRSPAAAIVTLDLVDPALLKTLQAHPQLLKILDSRVFEKVLAEILARLGYEIELQRGTKDGGVDIFAVKNCNVLGPHRYLLQAKRWEAAVGVEPVRELLFLHSHHKVTKSCLATTSRFTRGAWQIANDYKWYLELRDYEKLQEWVNLAIQSNDREVEMYNHIAAPDAHRALRGRRR